MNEFVNIRPPSRAVSPSPSYSSQCPPDSRPRTPPAPAKVVTTSTSPEKEPMLSPLDPSNASIRFGKQRSVKDFEDYFVCLVFHSSGSYLNQLHGIKRRRSKLERKLNKISVANLCVPGRTTRYRQAFQMANLLPHTR